MSSKNKHCENCVHFYSWSHSSTMEDPEDIGFDCKKKVMTDHPLGEYRYPSDEIFLQVMALNCDQYQEHIKN